MTHVRISVKVWRQSFDAFYVHGFHIVILVGCYASLLSASVSITGVLSEIQCFYFLWSLFTKDDC